VDRVGLRDWIEGRREKKKAAAEAEAAANKAKGAARKAWEAARVKAEMAAERRRIPQAKKYLELAKISLDKEEFGEVDDNLKFAFGWVARSDLLFQYFEEEVVSLGWDILDPGSIMTVRDLGGREGRHRSDIFYWVSRREEEYRRRKKAEIEAKLVEADQNLKLVKKWIEKEDFPKAKKNLGLAFASLSWTDTEWDDGSDIMALEDRVEAMFRDFEEHFEEHGEVFYGFNRRHRRYRADWHYGRKVSQNPHWYDAFPKTLEWMKGWLSEVISEKEGKYLKKEAARKKAKAKAAKAAPEKKKAKAKAAKAAAEKKKAAAEAEAAAKKAKWAAKKAKEAARVKAEKEQEEARVKAEKEQEEARVKAAAEAAAKIAFQVHWNKLDEFCIDQNISDELQEMVAAAKNSERMTPIDDVAHIHVRGWISHPNMRPIIGSILGYSNAMTLDDGDYLFTYREHDVLLEALGAGMKSMDWAKQLLESGFADNVKAMEMVVGGMSESAARKTFELGPEPDPVSVPIPDTDDDEFDSDDEDNELLL
jgi:hypothetical protein